MRNPRIPTLPEQVPAQGLFIPVSLPRRPLTFDVAVGFDNRSLPAAAVLKGSPRTAEYLFQAEWAWSPANNRLSAFYLHRGRRYWSLFDRWFDEDPMAWRWEQRGSVPLRQATATQAAFWLAIEVLKFDRDENGTDRWHWIAEVGSLSVAELKAIAHEVWGAHRRSPRRLDSLIL